MDWKIGDTGKVGIVGKVLDVDRITFDHEFQDWLGLKGWRFEGKTFNDESNMTLKPLETKESLDNQVNVSKFGVTKDQLNEISDYIFDDRTFEYEFKGDFTKKTLRDRIWKTKGEIDRLGYKVSSLEKEIKKLYKAIFSLSLCLMSVTGLFFIWLLTK